MHPGKKAMRSEVEEYSSEAAVERREATVTIDRVSTPRW
jgi:hypothetical protein